MNRRELERIGRVLNCGGKGGKPGPCPTSGGGFVGGISPMQVAMVQGMNKHNQIIKESKIRAVMQGKDSFGNESRLHVHDHPEKGLIYSLAGKGWGKDFSVPQAIEKKELLPKKWSADAESQIKAHFKKHNYITL